MNARTLLANGLHNLPESTACRTQRWCVLQLGHSTPCAATFEEARLAEERADALEADEATQCDVCGSYDGEHDGLVHQEQHEDEAGDRAFDASRGAA